MAKPSVTKLPGAAVSFFKEARDELKKVSWPSRETTIRYTLIVVISSVVIGMAIGTLDLAFTRLLETVI